MVQETAGFDSVKKQYMAAVVLIFVFAAIVMVSGCTQTNVSPLCSTDYVKLSFVGLANTGTEKEVTDAKDLCKTHCYTQYKLTSYKVTKETERGLFGKDVTSYMCYCDTNDCGGQLFENG